MLQCLFDQVWLKNAWYVADQSRSKFFGLFQMTRNRNLKTSKAPLESQAQGTSLFTSAVSNQRGCQKNSPLEAQVWLPEGERRQIRRLAQLAQTRNECEIQSRNVKFNFIDTAITKIRLVPRTIIVIITAGDFYKNSIEV